MKKILYFISVLFVCACPVRDAEAFAWPDFTPLLPFSPQFCVMCTPPSIDWAITTYNQVSDAKNRLQEMTNVTKIKQKLASYATNLGKTAFNFAMQKASAKKKVISYARTIEDSRRDGVNVRSEASVKTDFINLFFQYPSSDTKTNSLYRQKGKDLKADTALEMYITSTEMLKELCGEKGKGCELANSIDVTPEMLNKVRGEDLEKTGMLLQLSLAERCLMEGEYCDMLSMESCEKSEQQSTTWGSGSSGWNEYSGGASASGSAAPEDNVCNWRSSLQVMMIYDKIMKYNEMLVFMNAQYEAVMGIDTLAKIKAAKTEDEKKNKGAYFINEQLRKNDYAAKASFDTAFADEKAELSAADKKELAKYTKNIQNHDNVMDGNFEVNDGSEGFETEFDGKDDEIETLHYIEEAQKELNEAKMFHNFKQMLPGYRKVFKGLKQAREYHDKTLEYLQESGACVKSYLAPHYKDAAAAWMGNCDYYGKGYVYCHYEKEKKTDNEDPSIGLYDDVCPDDPEHKCYIQKLEDSDIKTGWNGVLLAYYDAGKVADALQETQTYLKDGEDDGSIVVKDEDAEDNEYTSGVSIDTDTDEPGNDSIFVTQRDTDDVLKAPGSSVSSMVPSADKVSESVPVSRDDVSIDEDSKDPAAAESLEEETRKGHLMNWIWGATVAEQVSEDISRAEPKFGEATGGFPMWNDQREFYDQYLEYKYINIGDLVKNAPFQSYVKEAANDINDIYPYTPIVSHGHNSCWIQGHLSSCPCTVTVSTEEIRGAVGEAIASVHADKTPDITDARQYFDGLTQSEKKTLKALIRKHKAKIASLEAEKKRLQSEIGAINTQRDEVNNKYNEIMSNDRDSGGEYDGNNVSIATAGETNRTVDESNKYAAELQAKADDPDVDFSTSLTNKQMNARKTGAGKLSSLKSEADAEKELSETLKKQAEEKAAELKSVNEKIENERRSFVKDFSDKEADFHKSFDDAAAAYVFNNHDNEVVTALVGAIAEASAEMTAKYSQQCHGVIINLPSLAATDGGDMIKCIRSSASKLVGSYKQSIDNLGDVKYYNNSAVVGVHNSMVEAMKSIGECPRDGVPSEPIAGKMFTELCNDAGDCQTPSDALTNDEFYEMEGEDGSNAQKMAVYFAGAVSLYEDYKAPRAAIETSADVGTALNTLPAPAREIFHFDISDYDSIEKYYDDNNVKNPSNMDITITAEGFRKAGNIMAETAKAVADEAADTAIKVTYDDEDTQENSDGEGDKNSGSGAEGSAADVGEENGSEAQPEADVSSTVGTFPNIWRYILRRHAYGQKNFDLTRLIGNKVFGDTVRGDPDINYLRSGAFPCYVKKGGTYKTLDVYAGDSKHDFGYAYGHKSSNYNETYCSGIFIDKKGKLFDYQANAEPVVSKKTSGADTGDDSELGAILAYVPDVGSGLAGIIKGNFKGVRRKLTFNPALQKAVNVISETEELGKDSSHDALFYMANRSLYDRNQFGDYLNQVEQEALAREALLKAENQVDGVYENLKDAFYGTGLVLDQDFDLLNEDDYKTASDKLKEQKDVYLNKALADIGNMKTKTESAAESVKQLKNTVLLLQTDSEEIVHINGTETADQLREKMETQKADNALEAKYDKMGDEAHERRLRNLLPPYCNVHKIK